MDANNKERAPVRRVRVTLEALAAGLSHAERAALAGLGPKRCSDGFMTRVRW